MRKQLRAAAVMVGVMAAGGAWAGDEEVGEAGRRSPTDLPSPIVARLHDSFPDATAAGIEQAGGGWEASVVEGLRRTTLMLDHVGNVVERHTPISVRALPAPVRASLERSHPRHTLWRATEIATDEGAYHEVLLARGDRRSVVLFDPTGRALAGVNRS
ncbi:MAG: hypothetical protein Q8P41_11580 [Pseudomonadota bacterium]|nr:hypothetical protein [Pseudomonadota bacterium]